MMLIVYLAYGIFSFGVAFSFFLQIIIFGREVLSSGSGGKKVVHLYCSTRQNKGLFPDHGPAH